MLTLEGKFCKVWYSCSTLDSKNKENIISLIINMKISKCIVYTLI